MYSYFTKDQMTYSKIFINRFFHYFDWVILVAYTHLTPEAGCPLSNTAGKPCGFAFKHAYAEVFHFISKKASMMQ